MTHDIARPEGANDFQWSALQRATSAVLDSGFVFLAPCAEVIGRKERYFKCVVERAGTQLEIFIYDDEAGVMRNGDDWTIFERPDYDSDEALLSSFEKVLRTTE